MNDRMIALTKIFAEQKDIFNRGISLALEDGLIPSTETTPEALAEAFINDADENYGDESCEAETIRQYIEDRL